LNKCILSKAISLKEGGGLHQGSTICDSDGSYYSRSTGRFAYEAIVHR